MKTRRYKAAAVIKSWHPDRATALSEGNQKLVNVVCRGKFYKYLILLVLIPVMICQGNEASF